MMAKDQQRGPLKPSKRNKHHMSVQQTILASVSVLFATCFGSTSKMATNHNLEKLYVMPDIRTEKNEAVWTLQMSENPEPRHLASLSLTSDSIIHQ